MPFVAISHLHQSISLQRRPVIISTPDQPRSDGTGLVNIAVTLQGAVPRESHDDAVNWQCRQRYHNDFNLALLDRRHQGSSSKSPPPTQEGCAVAAEKQHPQRQRRRVVFASARGYRPMAAEDQSGSQCQRKPGMSFFLISKCWVSRTSESNFGLADSPLDPRRTV